MPKKLQATEITNTFWIVRDGDEKIGTLTLRDNYYRFSMQLGSTTAEFPKDEINDYFEFPAKEVSSQFQKTVLGYPVIDTEVFNEQEQDNLPCFTKTEKSKVFFASGYYGIYFDNGGWLDSFCPKLSTLTKYPYIGPFKTESDMNIAIARKKRD